MMSIKLVIKGSGSVCSKSKCKSEEKWRFHQYVYWTDRQSAWLRSCQKFFVCIPLSCGDDLVDISDMTVLWLQALVSRIENPIFHQLINKIENAFSLPIILQNSCLKEFPTKLKVKAWWTDNNKLNWWNWPVNQKINAWVDNCSKVRYVRKFFNQIWRPEVTVLELTKKYILKGILNINYIFSTLAKLPPNA